MTFRGTAGFCLILLIVVASAATAFAAEPNQLTAAEKAAGWILLFDGRTPSGWRNFKKPAFPATGWVVEEGWLHCLGQGGGDIITDAEFDNFEFAWEWRLAPGGNSGVKYFVSEKRNSPLGHEYQLIDNERNADAKLRDGRRVTGSFYDVLKPSGAVPNPPGAINHSRLVVRGNAVEHWLNGEKVLHYECGSEALQTAIADSKFKNTPGFADKVKGPLLLQDHHSEIWFRNLKIRPVSAP